MLKADGFDSAVIGVVRRCGQPTIICYDYDRCVAILEDRDGMDPTDAVEYLEFNTVGAWVGEQTPGWLHPMTLQEIEDEYPADPPEHDSPEPLELGEPDDLSGTFIDQIGKLKARVSALEQELAEAKERRSEAERMGETWLRQRQPEKYGPNRAKPEGNDGGRVHRVPRGSGRVEAYTLASRTISLGRAPLRLAGL